MPLSNASRPVAQRSAATSSLLTKRSSPVAALGILAVVMTISSFVHVIMQQPQQIKHTGDEDVKKQETLIKAATTLFVTKAPEKRDELLSDVKKGGDEEVPPSMERMTPIPPVFWDRSVNYNCSFNVTRLKEHADLLAGSANAVDKNVLEVPEEDKEIDGALYNVSTQGRDWVSSLRWGGDCFHKVTNFCVVKGELTLYHDPQQGGARGGSMRMCTEFSKNAHSIRLKYRSEPTPEVLPGPLLTKTPGWIVQFWCQDLYHMTLTLMPAYQTWLRFFSDQHPDIYFHIARGIRRKGGYCRIKLGHPQSWDVVKNPRWGGDKQFPFAGNPFWPFYQMITKDPWRIHSLYKGGSSDKVACYQTGIIDKLYVKNTMGNEARNYSDTLLQKFDIQRRKRQCGMYRAAIIDRRGKTRTLNNTGEVVAAARQLGFSACSVALEHIPIREQIRLMAEIDVLIGVHGNGLIWQQFLQPGSVVIELVGIFYQPYARLWGHSYFHSSMKNNMQFKRQGEFRPFAHNITELQELLVKAKHALDETSCGSKPFVPPNEKLINLYGWCAPHC